MKQTIIFVIVLIAVVQVNCAPAATPKATTTKATTTRRGAATPAKPAVPTTTKPPTTAAPTTVPPTTKPAATKPATTQGPTTQPPTIKPQVIQVTQPPTTLAPTTKAPTTLAPTTKAPTTLAPTTLAPTTLAPTTLAQTTKAPTTLAPTTLAQTTKAPTTQVPTTKAATTLAGTTRAPTTQPPTTKLPGTTVAPTTVVRSANATTAAANATTVAINATATAAPIKTAGSYVSEVSGTLQYSGNVTLPSGKVVSGADPLSPELSKPDSAEFKELAAYMKDPIRQLYSNYDNVDVNITGFERGSIKTKYVATVRTQKEVKKSQFEQDVSSSLSRMRKDQPPNSKLSWAQADGATISDVKTTKPERTLTGSNQDQTEQGWDVDAVDNYRTGKGNSAVSACMLHTGVLVGGLILALYFDKM